VNSAGGDVAVAAPGGSILDSNPAETTDVRTEAQLLGLFDAMNLGSAASDPAAETIAAYGASSSASTGGYWQYRNLQPDPSVYDSEFRVALSPTRLPTSVIWLDRGADPGLTPTRDGRVPFPPPDLRAARRQLRPGLHVHRHASGAPEAGSRRLLERLRIDHHDRRQHRQAHL